MVLLRKGSKEPVGFPQADRALPVRLTSVGSQGRNCYGNSITSQALHPCIPALGTAGLSGQLLKR